MEDNCQEIKICFVGKYVSFTDAYISIIKAIETAALANEVTFKIEFIESILLEDDVIYFIHKRLNYINHFIKSMPIMTASNRKSRKMLGQNSKIVTESLFQEDMEIEDLKEKLKLLNMREKIKSRFLEFVLVSKLW